MFKRLCCWLRGHEWENLQTYSVEVSPIGKGIIKYRKCSRCGIEQNIFECSANFNTAALAKPTAMKPSSARHFIEFEDSIECTDDDKEKKTCTAECNHDVEVCTKEVQDNTKRRSRKVSGV